MGYNITQNLYSYSGYNNFYQNIDSASNGFAVPTQQTIVTTPTTTPNFRGQLATQPDTVQFSASNQIQTKDKRGLSTGAKWGLGTLAVAGIATLSYVLSKGRVGKQEAQQLAKHVDFTPAKTVEEAKKFAKEKLGVYYSEIDDVNMLNHLNEWLSTVYNKSKGNVSIETYPRFIANSHNRDGYRSTFSLYDNKMHECGIDGYLMGVNMDAFTHFDKFLDAALEVNHTQWKPILSNAEKESSFVQDLLNRVNNFDNVTATFEDRIRLYQDLYRNRDGKIINGQFIPANTSKFRDLWHELGHQRHQINCSDYGKMKKPEEYEACGETVSDITKEFLNDKNIQATAGKVSNYAQESPLEFVAETFANLSEGAKLDDDVMALYKKYGGPQLS